MQNNNKSKELKNLIEKQLIRELYLKDLLQVDTKLNTLKRCKAYLGNIKYFSSCERLMTLAKNEIEQLEQSGKDMPHGTLFIAEELTHAKGRLNRTWYAPKGGLYTCIVIYPHVLSELTHYYSVVAGIGVCEALRELNFNANIRWLNDILINNKKVCGILSEVFISSIYNETYILLGLGVNINIENFPMDIPNATSLMLEFGQSLPFLFTSSVILGKVIYKISLFEELHNSDIMSNECQDFFIKNWLLLNDSINKRVKYGFDADNNPEIINALVTGIDDNCGLILKLENGLDITVHSGEIRYINT